MLTYAENYWLTTGNVVTTLLPATENQERRHRAHIRGQITILISELDLMMKDPRVRSYLVELNEAITKRLYPAPSDPDAIDLRDWEPTPEQMNPPFSP